MQIFFATPQQKRAKVYNINDIRTGPPTKNRPQRPPIGLLLIAALVAIIIAVPKLKPEYAINNPANQTISDTESHQDTQQTSIASTDKTDAQIKKVYLSDDCTEATIELNITNNMIKPIIKAEITYTVNDNDGNEIAKATKTITKIIIPNEEYEDTETIDLGTIPPNGIEAKAHVVCYYWN